MEAYLLDWANLLLRWLHLIAGVAWIGASFYFVMLDSSLSKPARKQDVERGVSGELWAVHGGGVYQSQKFLLGPQANRSPKTCTGRNGKPIPPGCQAWACSASSTGSARALT